MSRNPSEVARRDAESSVGRELLEHLAAKQQMYIEFLMERMAAPTNLQAPADSPVSSKAATRRKKAPGSPKAKSKLPHNPAPKKQASAALKRHGIKKS